IYVNCFFEKISGFEFPAFIARIINQNPKRILSGDNMKNKKSKKNKNTEENLSEWALNPTVQADSKTEMGVPIPAKENVEQSKEYQEENEL
ncbi:MAG: hypothetical protein IKR97_03600, partial [Eubacterium sp.]|nr:hypothetical protein [Eubacterium sp.]